MEFGTGDEYGNDFIQIIRQKVISQKLPILRREPVENFSTLKTLIIVVSEASSFTDLKLDHVGWEAEMSTKKYFSQNESHEIFNQKLPIFTGRVVPVENFKTLET